MSQAKKKAESCHVVTKRNLQMASGLVTKPPKAKPSGLGRMKEHVETQRELAVHFERWGRGGGSLQAETPVPESQEPLQHAGQKFRAMTQPE
jgi:hypothetical protein